MNSFFSQTGVDLYLGDCLEVMRQMPECSVDAICTDPPYGIRFMGKAWDAPGVAIKSETTPSRAYTAIDPDTGKLKEYSGTTRASAAAQAGQYDLSLSANRRYQQWCEAWARECLRLLKPGGHLLASGGTRTYHRLVCAIEDAGFEIRDTLQWIYGSGFPKSLDVSKQIDKMDATEMRRERGLRFTAWLRSTGITAKQINAATNSFMGSHYLTDKEQPAVPTVEMLDKLRHLVSPVPSWVEGMAQQRTIESENFKTRAVLETVSDRWAGKGSVYQRALQDECESVDITSAATEPAKQWEGWGTALKPAHEPIIYARKKLNAVPALDKIAANTTLLVEALLWWIAPAKFVERCSKLSPADFGEGAGFVSARWFAAVLTTLKLEEQSGMMAMFSSQEAGSTFSNIAMLWNVILDDLSRHGSMYTTETTTGLITALKTLNSLILATTPESITKAAYPQNGLWSNAETAEDNSIGHDLGWKHTPKPSVGESAFLPIAKGIASTIVDIAEEYLQLRQATSEDSALKPALTDSTWLGVAENDECHSPASTAGEDSRSCSSTTKLLNTISADDPATLKDSGKDSAPKSPAHEPLVMARKPLSESSVARNVLAHSTGAINIEASRVEGKRFPANLLLSHHESCQRVGTKRVKPGNGSGRVASESKQSTVNAYGEYGPRPGVAGFTHLDHDGYEEIESFECARDETGNYICPVALLDLQSGKCKTGGKGERGAGINGNTFKAPEYQPTERGHNDTTSGASRFFSQFHEPDTGPGFLYQAKASRSERNRGLEGMPTKPRKSDSGIDRGYRRCGDCGKAVGGPNDHSRCSSDATEIPSGPAKPVANNHPTVKPLGLCDWLTRLCCPPGGTILDPFIGSGSIGCSAIRQGFNFIGIDQEAEYVEISRRRIAYWASQGKGEPPNPKPLKVVPKSPESSIEAQMSLFEEGA